jgi:osmoprotectant transport system permease protein
MGGNRFSHRRASFLDGNSHGYGSLIGIPLGILISRQALLAQTIIAIVNTLQTIPSLALFGFLISVPFWEESAKFPLLLP